MDEELKVKIKFCFLKYILLLNLILCELKNIAEFRGRKWKNLGNLIKMIGDALREETVQRRKQRTSTRRVSTVEDESFSQNNSYVLVKYPHKSAT